jgi:DNA-binding NarL/FixJ family response regulator
VLSLSKGSSSASVLLISLAPWAHSGVLESFRRNGARVSVATHPESALSSLRRQPELVLVDLAQGASLTRDVVSAINAGRGPWVVVALHDGSLDNAPGEAANLQVDGYCRPDDLIAHGRGASGAVFAASPLTH